MRNPKWSETEIMIVLDFYLANYPNIPDKDSDKVKDLVNLLKKLNNKNEISKSQNFRNLNGVYMKMMNFHHLNPIHNGSGLSSVLILDREIFSKYKDNKKELRSKVLKIKKEL